MCGTLTAVLGGVVHMHHWMEAILASVLSASDTPRNPAAEDKAGMGGSARRSAVLAGLSCFPNLIYFGKIAQHQTIT